MSQTSHHAADMRVTIERAATASKFHEHRQTSARGELRMRTGTSGGVPGLAWRHTGFHANGPTVIEVNGPAHYEMIAVQIPLRGRWNVEFADGRSSEARPLLSRMTTPTAMFSFSSGHYEQFSLQVTLETVTKWYGDALPSGMRALIADRLPGNLHRDLVLPVSQKGILRRSLIDTGPLQRLVVDGISLQLLGQFMGQIEDGGILEAGLSIRESKAAQDARRMIVEQVEDPPTMSELAAATKISARRLGHALQEEFGMTFHQIVVGARFDEACRALDEGEDIKSIAYRLGYANVSAFGHAFRKRFAMAPGRWREQVRRAGPGRHDI